MIEKIKAVMLGHAVGDALGVPVEFCSREELIENQVTSRQGYGSYQVPAGAWSDDTSMSLCTLESLTQGKIDYNDIMQNFGKWYYEDAFTPTGEMFDVGTTCSFAIHNYHKVGCGFHDCGLNEEKANGNGSLMRIHPMALYLYTRKDLSIEEKIEIIHQTSALTHAHERAKIACGIYSIVLWEILDHPEVPFIARKGLSKANRFYARKSDEFLTHYSNMLMRRIGLISWNFEDPDEFKPATRDDIKSSGYVVDTIEAAMYCLLKTKSYKDCVLMAVNLGDDTDTVAAIAGGLAGALYGCEAIPQEWLETLIKRDYIEDMCERANKAWIE